MYLDRTSFQDFGLDSGPGPLINFKHIICSKTLIRMHTMLSHMLLAGSDVHPKHGPLAYLSRKFIQSNHSSGTYNHRSWPKSRKKKIAQGHVAKPVSLSIVKGCTKIRYLSKIQKLL